MFASSLRLYFLVEIIKFRFFLEICIQILAISAFTDFGCLHSNGRFFVTNGTKSSSTIMMGIFMQTAMTCLPKKVSQSFIQIPKNPTIGHRFEIYTGLSICVTSCWNCHLDFPSYFFPKSI